MTAVYSGGLVYEYSQEASNYGLVDLTGGSLKELADFSTLQSAYSKTPAPSGDGGYKTSGAASSCPALNEPSWVVGTTLIPATPSGASKYFTDGAGTAPGLSNKAGSQTSGSTINFSAKTGGSAGTSNGASNSTSSGTTAKKGAAVNMRVPMESVTALIGAALFAVLFL